MRQVIAVILFTLFNLGAFGVTIKQHLCCHSQQEENTANHCSDDESCCGDDADCCDEIVSQIKIAKDYHTNDINIELNLDALTFPIIPTFYANYMAYVDNSSSYSSTCYFPPPLDYQIAYCSFLI